MSKRQAGFTLIELIFFIVVVGASLAGIQSVSTTIVKSSADPLMRKQSLAIAQSLLEEILLKAYSKPTGSTVLGYAGSGPRNLYDSVGDYQGYLTTAGIVDSTLTAVPGLTAYNISPAVSVTPATLGVVPVLRVEVFVTGPGGNVVSLVAYRGSY